MNLKILQNRLLNLYKEIAPILTENNLRYYVMFGSALGAYRHNGFIPWDDDFDIAMPREDLDRLSRIAKNILPKHIQFLDWHILGENAGYYIAKLQVADRDLVDTAEKESGVELPHGLFIDIFPIDGFPDTMIGKIIWVLKAWSMKCRSIYRFDSGYLPTFKAKVSWCIGFALEHIKPRYHLRTDYMHDKEFLLKSVPLGSTKMSIWSETPGDKLVHRLIPIEILGDGKLYAFEDVMVPLPADAEKFLAIRYGEDFMKLPPIEMQNAHHAVLEKVPWRYGI